MSFVRQALEERDLALLIVDASAKFGKGDEFALTLLKEYAPPTILLLNKIDRIEKSRLLAIIDRWRQLHDFKEIIPISALKRDGLDRLLDAIVETLPEGQPYFPPDQVTDQPQRFLAAEIIREQVLLATKEEVPYAATVVVEQFTEEPRLTRIAATIYCEREGQKAILIGKGGQMLKQIGTRARLEIEPMLGKKVFLELFVKVRPGWRDSREFVEALDWRRQLQEMAGRARE
jgi:GTP-binding protein Era